MSVYYDKEATEGGSRSIILKRLSGTWSVHTRISDIRLNLGSSQVGMIEAVLVIAVSDY